MTEDQIQKIVQAAQAANQKSLETALQQVLSNAGVLQKDLAFGNTGTTKFTDDTTADEAYQLSVLTNSNAWANNIKSLVEDARAHQNALNRIAVQKAELELKQSQHDFAQKQKLDHFENMRSIKAQGRNYDLPPFSEHAEDDEL